MKKCLFPLFFISLFCFSQTIPDSVIAFSEAMVLDYAKDYPGVSVSVAKGDTLVWNKGIGFSDLENKEPVASDTKFNIYSTSKFITGLAYLNLVKEQGRELLDKRIIDIDPNLPESWKGITVGHLLTHTSGIRHYKGRKDWIGFSDLRCASPEDAMQYFMDDPLKAKPGEKDIYTTYGMAVASHILEKLTGKNYMDALNGLLSFDAPITLDNEGAIKATPYIKRGPNYTALEGLSAECKYGGGGLIASSSQLLQAGMHLYDNSIMPLEEVKDLYQEIYSDGKSNGIAFAMGSGISETLGLYANMGGASPGGRSYLMVLADQKVAVALTTNCEGPGEKAYELASQLAKKFAGIE